PGQLLRGSVRHGSILNENFRPYRVSSRWKSTDKAFATAFDRRRTALFQLASDATTPKEWDQNVVQAYRQGYLSPTDLQHLYGNFGHRDAVMNSLTDAKALMGYNQAAMGQGMRVGPDGRPEAAPDIVAAQAAKSGATTSAEAAARAGYDTMDLPQQNLDGSYSKRTMTKAQALGVLRGQPGVAPNYTDAITSWENPSGNPAQPNASGPGGTPTTSAVGNGQFLGGTWAPLIRRIRPDLAGQSDDQLNALRSDPDLTRQATAAYAQQNAQRLGQLGIPATGPTLALSHRYGADGAATVLRAATQAPNLTLAQVLPNAAQANPQQAGQRIGDIVGDASRRFAMVAPPGQQASGGAGDAQAPAAGNAQFAAGTPPLPGVAGKPELSPQGQADLNVATAARTKAAQDMEGVRTATANQVEGAQRNNGILTQMNHEVDAGTWTPDKYSSVRLGLWKSLNALRSMAGMEPLEGVGDQEAYVKNSVQLLGGFVHQYNPQGGAHVTEAMSSGIPNDTMSKSGIKAVNSELMGLNDWVIAKNNFAADYQGNAAQFQRDWNNVAGDPTPFIMSRMEKPQMDVFAAQMNRTKEGRQEFQSLVGRMIQLETSGLIKGRA
ncbi:hypothetical protein, partial [Gluconacetobacter diazotrophicus]